MPDIMTYSGYAMLPGMTDPSGDITTEVTWGNREFNRSWIVPAMFDGAARDAGNTPTDYLRAGLLVAQVKSTRKFKEWVPTAPATHLGTEYLAGVLITDLKMQRSGTNQDRWGGYVMVGGCVKASALIVPGNASAGIDGDANEYLVRSLLSGRFIFDDYWYEYQASALNGGWRQFAAKTADYTVLEADHATFFTTVGAGGAVNFTLPAITNSEGLRFGFFAGANQNLTVTAAAAGQLIGFNNTAAQSAAFSTAGNKTGGFFQVIGIGGSKWAVIASGPNTVTMA